MAYIPHNVERSGFHKGEYVAYDADGFACKVKRGGRKWEAYSKRSGRYIGTRPTLFLIGALVASWKE